MDKPILALKLKNKIRSMAFDTMKPNLEFTLKNTIVNHEKRGCYGFITNTANGSCIYVNTEPCSNRLMCRYADNDKDFTGYTNRWVKNDLTAFAKEILKLLKKTPAEVNDRRL